MAVPTPQPSNQFPTVTHVDGPLDLHIRITAAEFQSQSVLVDLLEEETPAHLIMHVVRGTDDLLRQLAVGVISVPAAGG